MLLFPKAGMSSLNFIIAPLDTPSSFESRDSFTEGPPEARESAAETQSNQRSGSKKKLVNSKSSG